MGKAWWLSGLVAVVALAMAASANANILPVGQWDLNEGTGNIAHNDFAAPSGNGTLEGGVSWTSGRFRSGLSFDGVDGTVDVPASPALEGASVTVSAWVKAYGSPGDFRHIVVNGGNSCCTGSYGLYTGANGGLAFYVATSPTTYVDSPDAGTTIWNGRWHNVVGTFDGSAVRLYVDGRQVGSGSPDSSPIQYHLQSGSDLVIGRYPWCPGLDFNGDIDQVKVFNRALAPGEIFLGYLISNWLPASAPFDAIL